MKKYRIGEIAELFNVSKEMIRYYERCGIIKPLRTDSNYREYDALEQFSLIEATVLSKFNLNFSEAGKISQQNYTASMREHLERFAEQTRENILYEERMITRARELHFRMETAQHNIGRTWAQKTEGCYLMPYMISHNDEYEGVLYPDDFRKLFASKMIPAFLDAWIYFEEDHEKWYLAISDQYVDPQLMGMFEHIHHIEKHLSLCTVIDMGEIGQFQREKVDRLIDEMAQGEKCSWNKAAGRLVQRGTDSTAYHRLIELHIPLEE